MPLLDRLFIVALFVVGFAMPAHALASAGSSKNGNQSCDSICELLGRMASGQTVELTSADNGYYTHVVPSTSADLCKYFDGAPTVGGTSCSGTGASPWSSSSAIRSAIYPQGIIASNWTYSTYIVNILTGDVCGVGGGHAGGDDSGFYCLRANTAAKSILNNTGGAGWKLVVPSARWVTCATGKPPWSFQTADCSGTSTWPYFATTAYTGQKQIPAMHSYFCSLQVTGTNKWIIQGAYYSYNAYSPANAVMIVDDKTATTNLVAASGAALNGLYQVRGGSVTPSVAFDKWSGAVYSVNNRGKLGKVASPLSSGLMTGNGSASVGSTGCAYEGDVVIKDPAEARQVDYVAFGGGYGYQNQNLTAANSTIVFYDIDATTTPRAAASGIHSDSCSAGSPVGGYRGDFWDDDHDRILFTQGDGKLCAINFHGSNNPTHWSRDADTRTIRSYGGSTTPTAPPGQFLNGGWLPSKRPGGGGISGVILVQYGRVWLERP